MTDKTICRNPMTKGHGILLFVWNKFCLDKLLLGFCVWNDRYNALVIACLLEIHSAVNQSVQGIVLANTNIIARVVLCTTLANDDVACDALLATPNLYA